MLVHRLPELAIDLDDFRLQPLQQSVYVLSTYCCALVAQLSTSAAASKQTDSLHVVHVWRYVDALVLQVALQVQNNRQKAHKQTAAMVALQAQDNR